MNSLPLWHRYPGDPDYADTGCPEVDFTPASSDFAGQILATNIDCATATTVVKGVRGPCPSQPFGCRNNLPSYTVLGFTCAAGLQAQRAAASPGSRTSAPPAAAGSRSTSIDLRLPSPANCVEVSALYTEKSS